MEENKFEKQVQQKMDELQIQPSEAVWKKIELQIEKKKDRRWGLIVLFLCAGILLSGGYWLWNAGQQKKLENAISEKSKLEKNSNSSSAIKENTIVQQQINAASGSTNRKNNDVVRDGEKRKAKQDTSFNNSKPNQPFNSDDRSSITFSGRKKIENEMPGKTEMEISPAEISKDETANENAVPDSLIVNDEKIKVDTLSKSVVLDEIQKQKDTATQQTVVTSAKTFHQEQMELWVIVCWRNFWSR